MTTHRIMNLTGCCALVLALACIACPVSAEAPDSASGIQSPEQRNVRASAYTLTQGTWAFEAGVLGVNGEELYGSLGVKYGLGAGFELDVNFAHWAVGLFNISARWNFLDTPHFSLAASVDFTYGHGAWMWILRPSLKELVQDVDMIGVPIAVTASAPVLDWLQLDLSVTYRYGDVWGTLGEGSPLFASAEIGAQQVSFRPGARLFVSDATAVELAADIPVYTWVPWEGEISAEFRDRGIERSGSGGATLPPGDTWRLEGGVRSRIVPGFFWTVRLHYGRANKLLYRTTVSPSLSFEIRL